MPMTYASASTIDGRFRVYVDHGEITAGPIGNTFFGCGGVAHIKNLQEKLIFIARNGFNHHTTMARGHLITPMCDALGTYLGYDIVKL